MAVAAAAPAIAFGQNREASTGGYVFGGFGGIDPDDVFTYWTGHTTRAGVGFEHAFANGVLVQGDLEWLSRPEAPGKPSSVFPSINVGYEFGHAVVRPFVSGGYTASSSFIYNLGGGVNVRVVPHVAVRAEFRNHRLFFDEPLNSYGVRFGVTIR